MKDKQKEFYRYELERVSHGGYDIDGEFINAIFSETKLRLITYNLFKETPKGYWIGFGSLDIGSLHSVWKKWVSKTSKKRFAYPTKKEALINLIKRTERRKKILVSQVRMCSEGIELAKKEML